MISLLYPILWAFLTSLKSQFEWQNQNRNGLPYQWLFTNYLKAFMEVSDNGVSMVTMLFNSVWYTVGGTLLGVFVSSMTAHVTAKYDFPGKKVVYGISVFVMMLPIVGAMPSQYKIYTAFTNISVSSGASAKRTVPLRTVWATGARSGRCVTAIPGRRTPLRIR